MEISKLFSMGFDWSLFASTFALMFIAELPDKTAFAIVLMATEKNPVAIFVGAASAFVIQNLVAVCFGAALSFIPPWIVHAFTAFLFFVFAFQMWRKKVSNQDDISKDPGDHSGKFWKMAWSTFLVIFIAEWGDLTQLATATLVARNKNVLTIFCAATLALWTATIMAITVGIQARRFIRPRLLQNIAALAFFIVGVFMSVQAFRA